MSCQRICNIPLRTYVCNGSCHTRGWILYGNSKMDRFERTIRIPSIRVSKAKSSRPNPQLPANYTETVRGGVVTSSGRLGRSPSFGVFVEFGLECSEAALESSLHLVESPL